MFWIAFVELSLVVLHSCFHINLASMIHQSQDPWVKRCSDTGEEANDIGEGRTTKDIIDSQGERDRDNTKNMVNQK